MSLWQPQTEVAMTLWRWQKLIGRAVRVVWKWLFQSPNLWFVKRYPQSTQPIHNSPPPPSVPRLPWSPWLQQWDASCRQQRFFLGFTDFLSLPWITTETPVTRERIHLPACEIWPQICLWWYTVAAELASVHRCGCSLLLSAGMIVLV